MTTKAELKNQLRFAKQRIQRDTNKIFELRKDIVRLDARLDACLYAMVLMQASNRVLVDEKSEDEYLAHYNKG